MTLSLRLREYRQRRGLSQAQLARMVGVRQATVSALETGKSKRIELDLLERLAKVLKVRPAALLVDTKRKRG
jgi:transcriptional regulator with XRE-family HTH domain